MRKLNEALLPSCQRRSVRDLGVKIWRNSSSPAQKVSSHRMLRVRTFGPNGQENFLFIQGNPCYFSKYFLSGYKAASLIFWYHFFLWGARNQITRFHESSQPPWETFENCYSPLWAEGVWRTQVITPSGSNTETVGMQRKKETEQAHCTVSHCPSKTHR